MRQRLSSASCTQRTPAGLPCGMPGIGLVIEGAVQQAPQWSRQFMCSKGSRRPACARQPASITRRRSPWTAMLGGRCVVDVPAMVGAPHYRSTADGQFAETPGPASDGHHRRLQRHRPGHCARCGPARKGASMVAATARQASRTAGKHGPDGLPRQAHARLTGLPPGTIFDDSLKVVGQKHGMPL